MTLFQEATTTTFTLSPTKKALQGISETTTSTTSDDIRRFNVLIHRFNCRNRRRRSWRDKLDVDGAKGLRWDFQQSLSTCRHIPVGAHSWFVVFPWGFFSSIAIGWRVATFTKKLSSILFIPPTIWNLGRRFVSKSQECLLNRHVLPPII